MKKSKTRRAFAPHQKITAVLSVWTEKKTTTQMCRELSISTSLLNQWQNQAMAAMVTALSPKRPGQSQTLNPRLNRLIEKNIPDPTAKLQKRLRTIERAKAS